MTGNMSLVTSCKLSEESDPRQSLAANGRKTVVNGSAGLVLPRHVQTAAAV